jgi:hypothetical protein
MRHTSAAAIWLITSLESFLIGRGPCGSYSASATGVSSGSTSMPWVVLAKKCGMLKVRKCPTPVKVVAVVIREVETRLHLL